MNLQEEVVETKENNQLGLFAETPKVVRASEILVVDSDEKFKNLVEVIKKEEELFFFFVTIFV